MNSTLTLTEEQLYTLQAVLAQAGGEKGFVYELGAAFDLFETVNRMVQRHQDRLNECYSDPTNQGTPLENYQGDLDATAGEA
jgi:hypothetical protein